MGGDGRDAQGPGGVSPPGCVIDNRDDGETRGMRRVGVPLGSGGNGIRRDPPHQVVHQEAAGDHSRKGSLLPHL